MILSLIATAVKRIGIVCVVLLIAWHGLRHEAPAKGTAVVHIPEAGVVVWIDNRPFPVSRMVDEPVVCELLPGMHRVEIRHGPLTLGAQRFLVEPGKEAVLWPFPHHRYGDPESFARRAHVGGPGPVNGRAIRVDVPAGGAS